MEFFYSKKLNVALTLVLLVLILVTIFSIMFTTDKKHTQTSAANSAVNPTLEQMLSTECETTQETTISTEPTTEATEAPVATQAPAATQAQVATQVPVVTQIIYIQPTAPVYTVIQPITQPPVIQYATAAPPKPTPNYEEQWAAGYIIAIDKPDKTYKCAQVTLSDHDRDLVERLCMGEFGSGGFVGAALIAQSVKNAICFDGYRSVQDIIDDYHYTGRTDIPASDDCKKAVRYIFDQNEDAVQHRILYMYNPRLVNSEFHESQNYILTYQDVRFFDRWGY